MSSEGMDVDRVAAIADAPSAAGSRLKALIAAVDVGIVRGGGLWEGADAEQQTRAWHQARPILATVAADVVQLSGAARKNADEQRAVSSPSRASSAKGRKNVPSTPRVAPVRDMLSLARGDQADVDGYHRLDDDEIRRLGLTTKDPRLGFEARIYVDDAGHYVISYAGTQGVASGKLFFGCWVTPMSALTWSGESMSPRRLRRR